MRILPFVSALLIANICLSQQVIVSQKYSWITPSENMAPNVLSSTIFEGSGSDMQFVQMTSNAITPAQNITSLQIPDNEEHLLIVKEGMLTIGMNDSTWSIVAASIALLVPGQKYFLHNGTRKTSTFYVMKYRSKLPVERNRGNPSFVKDWNSIPFKPHGRGGVRNYFDMSTAMSRRFEMHVTTLNEGMRSHDPHVHRAEEIVLVIDNKPEMQIGERFYKGDTGDIYYLGSNVSHAIRNDGRGTCTYFAFQFE